MKNILTIFPRCSNTEIFKDVGQIPYTFAKYYGYKASIMTHEKIDIDGDYQHYVKIINIKKNKIKGINIDAIFYLVKNAKKIDILNLYHYSIESAIFSFIYKKMHKKGKVYLKLDANEQDFKRMDGCINTCSIKDNIIRKIYKNLDKTVNYISIESSLGMAKLKNINCTLYNKCLLIPNGCDDAFYEKGKNAVAKEKLIITVGRIGSYEKNHELLLDILEEISFEKSKWKFIFIGKIEEQFQKKVNDFILKQGKDVSNIIFFGPTKDRVELIDLYKRASVFILTSRYEGFPLVFPEAISLGNYIISSKLNAAEDVISNNEFGYIYYDKDDLKSRLGRIINDDFIINNSYIMRENNNRYKWDKLLNTLAVKINHE